MATYTSTYFSGQRCQRPTKSKDAGTGFVQYEYPLNRCLNLEAIIPSLSGSPIQGIWFCIRPNAPLLLYLFVGGFYQLLYGIFVSQLVYGRVIHPTSSNINRYNCALETNISGTLPAVSLQGRMHKFSAASLALPSPYRHLSSVVKWTTASPAALISVVTNLSYFVNTTIVGTTWKYFITRKRSQQGTYFVSVVPF